MYLIIGAGKTAHSCQQYCSRKNLPFLQIHTWQEIYDIPRDTTEKISEILLSPGIAPNDELRKYAERNNIVINNDIGVFLAEIHQANLNRQYKKSCILITGSNGKSTVVSLLAYLLQSVGLKAKAVGNIGDPVLDYLDNSENKEAVDFYVVEVSSFQLEVAQCLKANIAYITNITPDHLDRHGDIETYSDIKLKVYQDCDYKVANESDKWALSGAAHSDAIKFNQENNHIDLSKVKLLGHHNKLNILACLKILEILNIDFERVKSSLNSFSGLAHRFEFVAESQNVVWINDSKATNEASTLAAIYNIDLDETILILGGQTKGQKFDELISLITGKIKAVILIGESQDYFNKKLSNAVMADSLNHAVMLADQAAKPGDTVLFSPACSSFDMFANFEHRGNCFKALVLELLKQKGLINDK